MFIKKFMIFVAGAMLCQPLPLLAQNSDNSAARIVDKNIKSEQTSVVQNNGAPHSLLVEGAPHHQSVGRERPRLSWRSPVAKQIAYEIEAASLIENINAGVPDLWSSGRIDDDRSVSIAYRGLQLSSRDKVYWRVRIWQEGSDRPSAWSEFGTWQMGLLKNDDWKAQWITSPLFPAAPSHQGIENWLSLTADDPHFNEAQKKIGTLEKLRQERPATYFRKDFEIKKPVKSAMLYSTSAGYSEFYLSGEKLGDRILNPAQTEFDKRIYYDTDDVTKMLNMGKHSLAVHLGNGFYAERTAFGIQRLFFGEPAAIAQLEIIYEDGSKEVILSDNSWVAHPSPILKNGVYSGEVYDARKQVKNWAAPQSKSDSNLAQWQPVAILPKTPTEKMVAAEMPPVRRVMEIKPKAIFNPKKNIWTIDFGQNFTGVPTIDVAQFGLKSGQTLLFRFAEWADKNGLVSLNSGGSAPLTKQVDAYISDGKDMNSWSPTFSWHGFRYMEISGLDTAPPLDAITAHLTRTDLRRLGHFESSNPLLNRIHETALWTFESNMVSVLSDCPIRERNGWTGDALAIGRMASYNFDFAPYLDRFLADFRVAQVPAPAIVPGRRVRPGMVDWASAEIYLAWEHYLHSGDKSALENQYDSMVKYFDFVETIQENNQILNGNNYYGDWCDHLPKVGMTRPDGRCSGFNTKGDLTATALVAHAFDLMSQISERLERPTDAAHYAERYAAFRDAFHAAYFNREKGSYGSQTANAMAIAFKLVPPHLANGAAAAINRDVTEIWNGHASVGALGQTWLYPTLSDHGYTDTAYGIFTAEGAPGFSYLFDVLNGTTLWEDISQYVPERGAPPGKSLNHPFKGGYDVWFFSGLGGISPNADKPGYKHFNLRPQFPTDLDKINVSLETGYGIIKSQWERKNNAIEWQFTVPNNSEANVSIGLNDTPQILGSGEYVMMINQRGDKQISLTKKSEAAQ